MGGRICRQRTRPVGDGPVLLPRLAHNGRTGIAARHTACRTDDIRQLRRKARAAVDEGSRHSPAKNNGPAGGCMRHTRRHIFCIPERNRPQGTGEALHRALLHQADFARSGDTRRGILRQDRGLQSLCQGEGQGERNAAPCDDIRHDTGFRECKHHSVRLGQDRDHCRPAASAAQALQRRKVRQRH